METKQAYEAKVENKLEIFESQIENLQTLRGNTEGELRRITNNQVEFLKKKHEELETKVQVFKAAAGFIWKERKKEVDALLEDMMLSISEVHSDFIVIAYCFSTTSR